MNLILVGTDFSEEAVKAQGQAAVLAQATGSKLHLLHVLEPVDEHDSDDPETQEFYRKLEASSLQKLERAAHSVSGLVVEYSVEIGHRHPTVLDVAGKLGADMVVLGSRPMEPDNQRLGTSHRVALTSHIPVLLVP